MKKTHVFIVVIIIITSKLNKSYLTVHIRSKIAQEAKCKIPNLINLYP